MLVAGSRVDVELVRVWQPRVHVETRLCLAALSTVSSSDVELVRATASLRATNAMSPPEPPQASPSLQPALSDPASKLHRSRLHTALLISSCLLVSLFLLLVPLFIAVGGHHSAAFASLCQFWGLQLLFVLILFYVYKRLRVPGWPVWAAWVFACALILLGVLCLFLSAFLSNYPLPPRPTNEPLPETVLGGAVMGVMVELIFCVVSFDVLLQLFALTLWGLRRGGCVAPAASPASLSPPPPLPPVDVEAGDAPPPPNPGLRQRPSPHPPAVFAAAGAERLPTPVALPLVSPPARPSRLSRAVELWRGCPCAPFPCWLSPLPLLVALALCIAGFVEFSKSPGVVSFEVSVPNLPPELDGFVIAQLSDVHVGPIIGQKRFSQAIDVVNSLQADAVVITGDLTDGPLTAYYSASTPTMGGLPGPPGSMLNPLARLWSATNCTIFVSGNHDLYFGVTDYPLKAQLISNFGVTVLTNNFTSVPKGPSLFPNGTVRRDWGNASFDIIGVPDLAESPKLAAVGPQYAGQAANVWTAVQGRNVSRAAVFLAHQPGHVVPACGTGSSSTGFPVVLGGHTHGGQLLPVQAGAAVIYGKYWAGIAETSGTGAGPTCVNRISKGTYGWGIPLRLGAMHEVTRITLRSAPGIANEHVERPPQWV